MTPRLPDEHRGSSGMPWTGRTLTGAGFAGDDGAADPALERALAACLADASPAGERAVMAAVAAARWLVPVVATAPELGEQRGPAADTTTDLASVTLAGADGRRALPVFTSVAALAAWDVRARPVPVTAGRAARAAVAERCDVMVVDPASGHAMVLRPSMVWALAQRRRWLPAHEDPMVAQRVAQVVHDEDQVASHRLEGGEPPGAGVLRVVLAVRPGLDPGDLEALASRIGERIAADLELRARFDALTFTLSRA